MSENRAEARISLANIEHNYRLLCRKAGEKRIVMAVVKADAYGHGAVEVCRRLSDAGATHFAVACMEEAALLRRSGIRGELLVLGITPQELYPAVAEYDVVQTVSSLAYASQLADCGPVRVHIKIDTGMSRLGLYCHTLEDVARTAEDVARIAALPGLKVEGIFTHFAESDAPQSDFTRRQFAVFSALLAELERRGVVCGLRHCCNSAGILNFPEMHLDMVRAGIALYGCDPSPESRDAGLRPAMSLHSRVAFVSRIRPGDTVSYGRSYTADRPLDTAVISIGYADGLPRALSGRWSVRINGRPAPLIGKICMDLCVADVTGIPCAPGDDVVVFGPDNPAEAMADVLGTIHYELLCSVKNRVPRYYI